MLYLIGLPLLFLIIPSTAKGIILYLSVYLIVCFLLRKYMKKVGINICIDLQKPLQTVLCAVVLGIGFFMRWEPSSKVDAIAGKLHLSGDLFLFIVSLLLACASIVAVNILICIFITTLSKTEGLTARTDLTLCKRSSFDCKADKFDIIFCSVVALISAAIFFKTFPLSDNKLYYDSSIFIYIGKMMNNGKLPYVDLFDHKGIILYFIQYIGFAISIPGTYSGIWLIELINIFVFILLLYKTVSLFTDIKTVKYLSVLSIVMLCGKPVYENGNFTEEYALPWLALAFYIFMKYFLTESYKKRDIVLLGIGCAVVLMLRVNMAAIWAIFVSLTIISMIMKKHSKEIIPCILYFVIGLAVIIIPLLIYLIATGSLDSMIKYYILFNMGYSSNKGSIVNQLKSAGYFISVFEVFICGYILSLNPETINPLFTKRIRTISFLGFAVSLYFAVLSGRTYGHYGIVLLPLLSLPVLNIIQIVYNSLKEMLNGLSRKKYLILRNTTVTVICLLFVLGIFSNISFVTPTYDPAVKYLQNNTTENDDVLIIGSPDYYLQSGRKTENKFFYQSPPINVSDELYDEFLKEFEATRSDVILLTKSENDEINNSVKFIEMLNKQADMGIYDREEFEEFYVYTLVE